MSNTTYPQKPILVIVGPTASGKSALAVFLAKKFNGEIISADSRQVYRGLNLGSGKITKKEMKNIPHYLLDVASPKYRFSAVRYKKLAQAAIKKIQKKNKLPIICGGTGFYIKVLIDEMKIPSAKPNLALRQKLEKETTTKPFAILKKLDPRRSKNIDGKNRRRLIRAIEIIKITGQTIPKIKINPTKNALFLGTGKPTKKLKQLIARRLEKRIKQGLIKEVSSLHSQGLSWKKLDDLGLEYRWIARFLQKKINRQEMAYRLQKDIEHYAKRQITWFKKDPRVHWLREKDKAEKLVKNFLTKKSV